MNALARVEETAYRVLNPVWAAVGWMDHRVEKRPHLAAVIAVGLLTTKELITDLVPALDAGLFNTNPLVVGTSVLLIVTAVLLVLSATEHSIFSVSGFVAAYLAVGVGVLVVTFAILYLYPVVIDTQPLWFEAVATVSYACWLAALFASFQYFNLYGQRDDPEVPS